MKILLIGNDGRTHALAWKLSQSAVVQKLWVAPGNGATGNGATDAVGTGDNQNTENVDIPADDVGQLCAFAQQHQIDLTIVGSDRSLMAGIVDQFHTAGLHIFGPRQQAAQLEASRVFAKEFMQRHNIPTAKARVVDDFDDATRYLRQVDDVPVVKVDGLVADLVSNSSPRKTRWAKQEHSEGTGVLLPDTRAEVAHILQTIFFDGRFGEAGHRVLLEEPLSGREMTLMLFSDGTNYHLMPPVQSYKRLTNDYGSPNTQGMGAFAPTKLSDKAIFSKIEQEIIQPTLEGLAAENSPFVGVLSLGIILTKQGPKLLDYNCCLDNPEAQVVLALLETDLVEIVLACLDGTLSKVKPVWRDQTALNVVMAVEGYPFEYTKGVEIFDIAQAEHERTITVFHNGTKCKDGRLITDGGRVLSITSVDDTLGKARHNVYQAVDKITYNELVYRRDIGRW